MSESRKRCKIHKTSFEGTKCPLCIIDEQKMQGLGLKFDDEKPATGLLPPKALEEESKVWGFGAKKYAAWNWTKGLAYTRVLGAALRHLLAIMRGEDRDPETGLLHAAHIRCCMAMIIEYHYMGRKDLDDRLPYSKTE